MLISFNEIGKLHFFRVKIADASSYLYTFHGLMGDQVKYKL